MSTFDNEVPETIEAINESARRGAIDLGSFELDEHIAVAQARRDVAAAHGRTKSADAWQAVLEVYAERRATNVALKRAVDEAINPFTTDLQGQ